MDEFTEVITVGVVFSTADLLTTLTPIPLILRLQMPLRQRIGACLLLSLGLIITLAGCARTFFVWKSLDNSWDQTWWVYPLYICATMELDIAVVSLTVFGREGPMLICLARYVPAHQHSERCSSNGSPRCLVA